MNSIATHLRAPAIISFLLVLPFMLLELMFNEVNTIHVRRFKNALDFVVLFGLLWLLPTTFFVILMPLLRDARAGNNLMAHPISLLLRVALLVLIATMWGSILFDQLPCFLGVPNCD